MSRAKFRKATPKFTKMQRDYALANARLDKTIWRPRYELEGDYEYKEPSMSNPVPSKFGIDKCAICGCPHPIGTALVKCGDEGFASVFCVFRLRREKMKRLEGIEPCEEEIIIKGGT